MDFVVVVLMFVVCRCWCVSVVGIVRCLLSLLLFVDSSCCCLVLWFDDVVGGVVCCRLLLCAVAVCL